MSHSFPPPPKRRPWWKFKTTGALLQDRKHYRAAMANYDRQRAAQDVPPVKKNWFARHKILSSIIGFFVAISLLAQCGEGTTATVADPAPALTTAAAPPVPAPTSTSAPAPTPSDTAAAEAERKRTEEARKAADKKAADDKRKAAAEEKKREDAAAKKKADDETKRKAAAAKKKADQEKADREEQEQQEQERRDREQAQADSRNTFDNCTDMNATYPHGVGQPGASDETRGSTRPVTNFKRDANIYALNSGSDRDDDGVACEQL